MPELESEILDAIKPLLTPYQEKLSDLELNTLPNEIEVTCRQGDSQATQDTLLRLTITPNTRQIHINRISTPGIMKGQGLGKQLIRAIYIPAKAHGYEVFVTDMAPGFYERLLRRGARSCNDEMVQINDDTVLA